MRFGKILLGLFLLLGLGGGLIFFWIFRPLSKVNSTSKPISHKLWDSLLQKHVSLEGRVNYPAFQADSLVLKEYLELLTTHHPNDAFWSVEEQQAYWMNAYNAFTVELVLKHYPLKSIKDIAEGINLAFVNTPWDIQFITIEGHSYDLNNIEHNILRPQFKDPRIHVGVNCASISCPNLPREAFTGAKLTTQLDSLMRVFLQDTTKNVLNTNHIKISKIFKWFKGDFTKQGSLISFLNQYAPITIDKQATIDYKDYNWNLNEINK